MVQKIPRPVCHLVNTQAAGASVSCTGGRHCNEMLQKVIPSPVKHWAAVPAAVADDGSISAIASHIEANHSFI